MHRDKEDRVFFRRLLKPHFAWVGFFVLPAVCAALAAWIAFLLVPVTGAAPAAAGSVLLAVAALCGLSFLLHSICEGTRLKRVGEALDKAEEQAQAGDWAGFSETQKRIAHALRNTKRVLGGKDAVEMDPLRKLPVDIKEQMFDARDEPIPPEFEQLVAEYYKAIAAGAMK